jgi:MoaA/NifB/PqqE/SkfB family radical SAM enzyme
MIKSDAHSAPSQGGNAALTVTSGRLLAVQWEVTERCNLLCQHCYLSVPARGGVNANADLSFDEALNLFDGLAGLGVMFITFTGGEVFLRPDFLDLCTAARARGFGVRILTNATRIGEVEARRLAELGIISVELTVYGASASGYRRATGVANGYRDVRRGIRALRRHGVPVVVKVFYMRANADEVDAMEAMAEREGVALVRAFALLPRYDEGLVPLRVGLTRQQLRRVAPVFGDVTLADSYDDVREARACGRCGMGRLFITAGGQVTPCASLRNIVFGNVRESSIGTIWRSASVQGMLRSVAMAGARPFDFAKGAQHGPQA